MYADESNTHDDRLAHSRFYGGSIVCAHDRDWIVRRLERVAGRLGLLGEIKWRKVRPQNAARVQHVIDDFFDLVAARYVKLRGVILTSSSPAASDIGGR